MIKNIKYIAIMALGVVACEPEFDNPLEGSKVYTNGDADFSKYIALGNSITAGFADNALYIKGQENAYPNILAQQFATVGGGEFSTPLMADNVGGFAGVPVFGPRLVLSFGTNGTPSPSPYTGKPSTTNITTKLEGPFSNMGVPGAKSFHLIAPGYGNAVGLTTAPFSANPYFVRFASQPETTILTDAMAQNPTFFSLWIGNNDILSYASSGGIGLDHNETGNVDPKTYGPNDITNNIVFAGAYKSIVDQLVKNGAKGVVVNLADVTSIPFFTTAPINALPLSEAQVAAVVGSKIPEIHNMVLGKALQEGIINKEEYQSRLLKYVVGQNKILTKDQSLTDLTSLMVQAISPIVGAQTATVIALVYGQARQTKEGDLVTLDAASKLGIEVNPVTGEPTKGTNFFTGINYPADNAVLEISEQQKVTTALNFYNATIKALATANGLAFFDANAALKQAATTGLPFNGGVVTSTFASGGAFTLDGVHPTPRTHAITANAMIKSIESTYKAMLPKVDAGNYGTITLSNDVN